MNFQKIFLILCFLSLSICSFGTVKFSQSDLNTFINSGTCQKCDLVDVGWEYSDHHIKGRADYQHAVFSCSYLDRDDFGRQNFNYANFSNTRIVQAGASFTEMAFTDFTNANLTGTDFTGTTFVGANVQGANFKGCDLSGADFTDSNITEQQLSEASNLCNTILPDGTKHKCE